MVNSTQDRVLIKSDVDAVLPRPTIVVFDSGVGGLSVYDEVRRLLPNAHYLYIFDNAAFPYGEKEAEFIVDRVVKIIGSISQHYKVALAIIACNTASTISLPSLRARFHFPVVGVVPAIKPAAQLTRNGVIGLLATKGTINREYTHELVAQFAEGCQVKMIGAAILVQLAEKKLYQQAIDIVQIKEAIEPWLSLDTQPDTIILGCTHFPLLKQELAMVFPKGTAFVDSGAAIARRSLWLVGQSKVTNLSLEENLAFCTAKDARTALLLPILRQYGFQRLEYLSNIEQIG